MSDKNSESIMYAELRILILRALDGTITCEETARLEDMLKADMLCRKYYRAFMFTYCNIESVMGVNHQFSLTGQESDEISVDQEFLSILAEQEDKAPELILKNDDLTVEEDPDIIEEEPLKPNSFNRLFNIIVSVAAVFLVFFIIYANIFPPRYSKPVATIVDHVGIEWTKTSETFVSNDRILTNHPPYAINEGVVKIRYDRGVDVLIEGPAEFEILDEMELKLCYGRAYSLVSNEGKGFSVVTDNARIIDLGTEFGVQVDANGDTSVHVIKGKTQLLAGDDMVASGIEVNEGAAKRVAAKSQVVSDIYCKQEFFVRDISSESSLVWRGQEKICLADIVGGGNGFGTGEDSIALDPGSGKISNEIETETRLRKDNMYYPVEANQFIDGVFVPFGGEDQLKITSQGHLFEECPDTEGKYWMGISNKPVTNADITERRPLDFRYVKLDGIQYGTNSHPAIMMHANCGITFDLDSIREINTKKEIVSFVSTCGLSDTIRDTDFDQEASAVLWVLVDGSMRERVRVDINANKASLEVALNGNDRFLTLISTDSNKSINCDWTFFGDPAIVLE